MNKKINNSKDFSSEIHNMCYKKNDELINIMDIEPDPEVLFLAREYDKRRKKKKPRKVRVRHVVALFMICFITISAITLETSSALKLKLYQIFFSEEEGSATLFGQDEYDLIGEWKDYWYPTYLPEEFKLQDAERSELEKIILFSSENGVEIRIIERPLDAVMSTDTDYTSMKEVRIGYSKGYLFTNVEYEFMEICWVTDDRQISIDMIGAMDEEILIKVAENLKYKK